MTEIPDAMRTWSASPASSSAAAFAACVTEVIPVLGEPAFGRSLLGALRGTLPAASLSVYRTGPRPTIFMSASLGVTDTTRDCWRAYLSGPVGSDRSFGASPGPDASGLRVCHITAAEVPLEHRTKVYDAHGVSERVSVVSAEVDGGLFALNVYRHTHQRALRDAELADFGALGSILMAMTRKHLSMAPDKSADRPVDRLQALRPDLTPRELQICALILDGMTHDGIAAHTGLGLPTVKTYRNRAFTKLDIHFKSELFALMLRPAA
ncbi:MAG: LuxR C-terminal-related transcriptional regulator [Pseudomonadota bacterium]